MAFEIKGKIVLVTGASGGIGRATAQAFAKEGAKVALAARNEQELLQTQKLIADAGGKAGVFPLDLSKASEISQMVKRAEQELGSVDVLVNNAAYGAIGLVEDCPLEQYRKNFEVNFFAVIALIQAVLPGMKQKRSGQVINVSSGVGRRALPGVSSYSATKFALNGLTESLRVEMKPFGIDVILISPGRVETRFHERTEHFGKLKFQMPVIKMRTPDKIAEMILDASRNRKREAEVWGPGKIGHYLNFFAPALVDFLVARRFPTEVK